MRLSIEKDYELLMRFYSGAVAVFCKNIDEIRMVDEILDITGMYECIEHFNELEKTPCYVHVENTSEEQYSEGIVPFKFGIHLPCFTSEEKPNKDIDIIEALKFQNTIFSCFHWTFVSYMERSLMKSSRKYGSAISVTTITHKGIEDIKKLK